MKILLVDDNVLLPDMLRAAFKPYGYALDYAADGDIGLEMLNHASYDAILLDLSMPVLDGYQFLDKLPAGPKNIIILSGRFDLLREGTLGKYPRILTKVDKPFSIDLVKDIVTLIGTKSSS